MINLIVAFSQNRVIGIDNSLPWHLPEDLKNFKKITMGHALLMGRKTYESIGRPLPGRQNIVLSRAPNPKIESVDWVSSFEQAVEVREAHKDVFIIGGSQIYKNFWDKADRLYITVIEKDFEGDAYLPEWNQENYKLIEKTETQISPKENLPYHYEVWEKI